MKCEVCGKETGADWKRLCLDCYKAQKAKEQKERIFIDREGDFYGFPNALYTADKEAGELVCNLCGKRIKVNHWHSGDALLSHARMHVRRGEAVETHVESDAPRFYGEWKPRFTIAKGS